MRVNRFSARRDFTRVKGGTNGERTGTQRENSPIADAEGKVDDPKLLQTLQAEIEKGLSVNTPTQAKDITNRIAEIDHKFAVIVFGY